MTTNGLQRWIIQEELDDTWWVAINGEVADEFYTLKKIERILPNASTVLVKHVSAAKEADNGWIELEIQSHQRRHKERRKHKDRNKASRKRIFRQLYLLFFVTLGFFSYVNLRHFDFGTLFDQEDVYGAGFAKKADTLPALSAEFFKTDRIVYIHNRSDSLWPSGTLYLNSKDSFKFELKEAVSGDTSFQVPIRQFAVNGEFADVKQIEIKKIIIEVPGFKVWEQVVR